MAADESVIAAPETETTAEGRDNVATLQPFRLVKFFSFTGLGVVLIAALVLSWMVSNYSQKVMLERRKDYAVLLAENLNNQIFLQFVVPIALQGGEIRLRDPRQFKKMDTIVRNIIHGLKIDSVTIFDSSNNIISYSTIDELVGKQGIGGKEYQRALNGINSTEMTSSGSLLSLLPGSSPITCKLTAFIPFRPERREGGNQIIIGVTEIVLDLSDDLTAIIRLQGTIIVTSILIMGALFVVLRSIVAQADRIIEARAEERRRLEAKLDQSKRLAGLGKMVAAVSHEIKNPLGIVSSTAEILNKRLKGLGPGNDHLAEIIIAETHRLDGIVMEFLDFARPQTPELTKTDINDTLTKVVRFMEPELDKHHIKTTIDLSPVMPLVPADANLLYRAFLNILVNAVQAMDQGGTLTVATGQANREAVRITISDTGSGIPEEKMEMIFNPFYTDKNRGTGLGLAIVKNIIDSHDGTIEVASQPGEFTTFTITLGLKAG
jgi:two-component system sensor histidine kinase HydH